MSIPAFLHKSKVHKSRNGFIRKGVLSDSGMNQ
jgi:hypothetical protein